MPYNITLMPGDGIGPEITEATKRVLEAAGVAIDWDIQQVGESALARHGTPLPEVVLKSIRNNGVALKGPVTTPVGAGFRSVNVAIRRELDLYACVRPCKSYRGIPSRYSGLDIIVVRESTEDLYSGIEFEKGSQEATDIIKYVHDAANEKISVDSGISLKPISESATRRIVTFAFVYARAHRRKR